MERQGSCVIPGGAAVPSVRTGRAEDTRRGTTDVGLDAVDFDGDGRVGFPDFLMFARAYDGADLRFDLNGSGQVDFPDFLIFARNFGRSGP